MVNRYRFWSDSNQTSFQQDMDEARVPYKVVGQFLIEVEDNDWAENLALSYGATIELER